MGRPQPSFLCQVTKVKTGKFQLPKGQKMSWSSWVSTQRFRGIRQRPHPGKVLALAVAADPHSYKARWSSQGCACQLTLNKLSSPPPRHPPVPTQWYSYKQTGWGAHDKLTLQPHPGKCHLGTPWHFANVRRDASPPQWKRGLVVAYFLSWPRWKPACAGPQKVQDGNYPLK